MVFATGDTHGNFLRFRPENFPEQENMTKNDYVIICGDFGGVWDGSKKERQTLDWLESLPFTVLFVSGNHENFDLLKKLPVEEWHGGKVQFIRPHVIHLLRGQVFELEGYTFFTMGGASSHNISDGILDPYADDFEEQYWFMRRLRCSFRVDHHSWWKEELPSDEEYTEALKTLKQIDWAADYIINIWQNLRRHIRQKNLCNILLHKLPWGPNTVLLDKLSNTAERLWYAEQISKNGWSRNVLVHQIESGLYQRQVLTEKVSNFENRLSSPQSELAVQTMKDPYIFDFIPFKPDMVERDIEQVLVKDVTKLLLELGTGFAFLGNQYHLNVGGDDFYIDLLFYNLNLRRYVVIELKTGEFKPEYAGQLNFYLSAVDDILKKEQDSPSIGLLLCKSKNDLVAEYSLKDMSKPIGVSAYQITSNLPEELEKQLPSVEDIQKRIQNI